MRSSFKSLHKVNSFIVHLLGRRTHDPVILNTLFFTVSHNIVMNMDAAEPAGAGRAPVKGDLITGNRAGPVRFVHKIKERSPPCLRLFFFKQSLSFIISPSVPDVCTIACCVFSFTANNASSLSLDVPGFCCLVIIIKRCTQRIVEWNVL